MSRLDDAGLDHLLSLTEPGTATVDAPTEPPSALVRLLDSLLPAPGSIVRCSSRMPRCTRRPGMRSTRC